MREHRDIAVILRWADGQLADSAQAILWNAYLTDETEVFFSEIEKKCFSLSEKCHSEGPIK